MDLYCLNHKPGISILRALWNLGMFLQAEARAEKALALIKAKQISLGLGITSRCWSIECNAL